MKKLLSMVDNHLEEVIMSVFLAGIVVFMSIHVFCRYVLKAPLTWSEEATRYMFIWFVFMGVSYGIKNDTHIRVNILESFFPKLIKPFRLIRYLAASSFILYLLPASYKGLQQIAMRKQISAGLHIPMTYIYGALFVGLCLSVIRILQILIQQFLSKKEGKSI